MAKPSKSVVFKATCTILVIVLLGQISLLFICQCDDGVRPVVKRSTDCLDSIKVYSQKLQKLQRLVKKLKEQLSTQSHIIQKLGRKNQDLSILVEAYKRTDRSKFTHHIHSSSFRDLTKEFSQGEILNSEFVVNTFSSYAFNAIYSLTNGLSNNPAQRPLPQSCNGKEYNDAVNFAVKQINEDSQDSREASDFDLVDGITRTDSLKGAEYELYFRNDQMNVYHKVRAVRTFSRGLGLQKGALAWNNGNVILFFCDVDIYFTPDFLERCRFYSSPGQQVYYPVVFSLYNPMIVYGGDPPPSLSDQFKINRDTGFWRQYGFGMVCHYRSDFIKTGGFDLTIKGWGKEDIKLYRKYLYSKIKVVRSVDRGIFHMYHHKHCTRDLTDAQYIACLNSKVKSEGSHTQLGLIAFGGNIFDSKNPNWIEKLQAQAAKQQQAAGEQIPITKTNPNIPENE
ncbi:Chondroitin sulfate N-acetylgalactosaminyltransferase 1 [Exaiptasia diaphana]|nr:Chondroitin sulfate N-acetylgalactosaminyltransferase 1 [Exaiptasia diaphana]